MPSHRSLPLIRRRFESVNFFEANKGKVPSIVVTAPGLTLPNHRVAFPKVLTVEACLAALCAKIPGVDPADVVLEAQRFPGAGDAAPVMSSLEPTASIREVYDVYRMDDDATLYLCINWKVENEPFEWEVIEPVPEAA